jgi:hypothetical protein
MELYQEFFAYKTENNYLWKIVFKNMNNYLSTGGAVQELFRIHVQLRESVQFFYASFILNHRGEKD